MKVVSLNALQEGGAARAAMRLLRGLQEKGVDARLIVQRKDDGGPYVVGPQTKKRKGYGPYFSANGMAVCLVVCT